MGENIRRLKMNSKAIIMMSRWQPVYIAALYAVVVMLLSSVVFYASGYIDVLDGYMAAVRAGNIPSDIVWPTIEITDMVIVAAAALVLSIVGAGFNIAMLMLSRGKIARARDLLGGFSMPLKVLVICVLKTLLTALGYMFFVIPGFVAEYMFRYSVEILYDDPSVSPVGALRRSAAMTSGHKAEMFMLDLSFIPWHLASSFMALALSFSVLDAWIMPYVQLAFSVHYNKLSGWQPNENDDTSENYVIWARVNEGEASSSDMQGAAYPVQQSETPQPATESTAAAAVPQADETAPKEESVGVSFSVPAPEKPAPNIEYWKTRAIQLQKEMQDKNKAE